MSARAVAWLGSAVGAAVLVTAFGAWANEPTEDGAWSKMIDDARSDMNDHTFSGVMEIRWRDGDIMHETEIEVRHTGEVLEVVADKHIVANRSELMLDDGEVWSILAHARDAAHTEMAPGKYAVARSDGPIVAGFDTTRFEASRDGVAVQRVYIDDESGMVMRRETLDEDGTVIRSVAFVEMELVSDSASLVPPSSVPPQAGPRSVDDLAAPMRDPDVAGDGFRLLGRWKRGDVAQLYYSDGLLSVSVFEERGRLDWLTLPAGSDADVDGHRARRYALPVGEALVFARGGIVYTCIGDAPAQEILDVARDASAPNQSRSERLADAVLAPFGW